MLPRIHPDRMQIAFDDHCAPASSLFYWNRAWPVRLPLPISPCVNARAHRFGGFGVKGVTRPHRPDIRRPRGVDILMVVPRYRHFSASYPISVNPFNRCWSTDLVGAHCMRPNRAAICVIWPLPTGRPSTPVVLSEAKGLGRRGPLTPPEQRPPPRTPSHGPSTKRVFAPPRSGETSTKSRSRPEPSHLACRP